MDRLDEPEKSWKFSASDVKEREFWNDYMHAFEEAIRATASKDAPWFVVPADNKWFSRLLVAAAIVEAMASLDLAYPKVDAAKKKELAAVRAALSRCLRCWNRRKTPGWGLSHESYNVLSESALEGTGLARPAYAYAYPARYDPSRSLTY